MKIEKKDLPKGVVEFKIIVDENEFETYRSKGFASIQKAVEIDGFRKGNAPEEIIVKKYGDMIILEEMANLALRDAYIKAIDEHKITPISEPQVSITKLAKGNPLELTITVPIMPEIVLPSYKKIASEVVNEMSDSDKTGLEVTDKDIEIVLEELRKGRAKQQEHVHTDEPHEHKIDEATLPELNDEFAKSFGDSFTSLVDLKTKIGENLKLEKEQKLREKRRTKIMDKLVAETKIEMPDVIVEGELSNMLAQMKADMTRFGGTWEEYLTHSKKTEEQFKSDWRNDAEKRALSQLLLHKIAQAEKLTATDEEIEVELVRVLATVQDADENRAKSFLYQALTNEKVLKFLEEGK